MTKNRSQKEKPSVYVRTLSWETSLSTSVSLIAQGAPPGLILPKGWIQRSPIPVYGRNLEFIVLCMGAWTHTGTWAFFLLAESGTAIHILIPPGKAVRRIIALNPDGYGPAQNARLLKQDQGMDPCHCPGPQGKTVCQPVPEAPCLWGSAASADSFGKERLFESF